MLKKIVLGLLIGLSTLAVSAAELTTVIHENAVGYKDAKEGSSFPASLTEMIGLIGKKDSFEIAFNKDKNKDAFAVIYSIDYKEKHVNFSELKDTDVIKEDNMTFSSDKGISYLKVDTNVTFRVIIIKSTDYTVRYTVSNGHLYRIEIETTYQYNPYESENLKTKDNQKLIIMKISDYLKNRDFKRTSSWSSFDKIYENDNIRVDLTQYPRDSNYSIINIEDKLFVDDLIKKEKLDYDNKIKTYYEGLDRIIQ